MSYFLVQIIVIYLVVTFKKLFVDIYKAYKDETKRERLQLMHAFYFGSVRLSSKLTIVRPVVGILKRIICCLVIFCLNENKLPMFIAIFTLNFFDVIYIIGSHKSISKM
jgi:hypothetical protein